MKSSSPLIIKYKRNSGKMDWCKNGEIASVEDAVHSVPVQKNLDYFSNNMAGSAIRRGDDSIGFDHRYIYHVIRTIDEYTDNDKCRRVISSVSDSGHSPRSRTFLDHSRLQIS